MATLIVLALVASLLPKPVIVCDLSPVTCHNPVGGGQREDTTPGGPGSWAGVPGGSPCPISGLRILLSLLTPRSHPEDTALGQRSGAETIWMGDATDPLGAQHQLSRFWWQVQPHRTSLVSPPDHQTCRWPTWSGRPWLWSLPAL